MLLTLNGKQIPEKWIDYPYVRIPKSELTLNPNYVPKFTKKGKDTYPKYAILLVSETGRAA